MAPKHLLLNRVHTSWTCLFNLFVNIVSVDHLLIADDIKLYIQMDGVMPTVRTKSLNSSKYGYNFPQDNFLWNTTTIGWMVISLKERVK